MEVDKRVLLYDCLAEFKRQLYKDLLSAEHVNSPHINVKSLTYTNGYTDKEANFWGWTLEKNGDRYLVRDVVDGKPFDIADVLPIQPLSYETVSYKGIGYRLVSEWAPARFKAESKWTFKEFVDRMACFEHSNPKHYKLLWLIVLTQLYGRANIRVATAPGFGKDSIIDIMRDLVGDCASVQAPTLARLQRLVANKLVVINEVSDLSKEELRKIEQFLQEAGAGRSEITRHSLGTEGSTKAELNIARLSISLYYNTVDHMPNPETFFDFVSKGAVQDRFLPICLNGRCTEDFNKFKTLSVSEFAAANMDKYKELIYAHMYFKQQLSTHQPRWERGDIPDYSPRWRASLDKFLVVLDAYAETQEEYADLERTLIDAISDYQYMLEFANTRIRAADKLDSRSLAEADKQCKNHKLFKEKIAVLKQHLKGETNYGEAQQHKFW